jgi:HK97 family phage prohead protease
VILTAVMATPNTRSDTVELPTLCRSVSVVPNSVNVEKRTVDVVWTTGARVLRGYYDRYWEELSLEPKHVRLKRLNNGAPFLNTHDGYDAAGVIGVVESKSARIENGQGVATVRFAKAEDDPEADKIFRKVVDGILQNISVGYNTYKMEKVEDGADKVPVFRAVDWEPYELSVVPMGADDGAGFRAADMQRVPCVFVTRMQETATMADENKPNPAPAPQPGESPAVAATRAATMARIEDAKERAAQLTAEREAAIAEERVRSAEIRKIGSQSGLGEEWALKLIEVGTSVDEARRVAFNEMTKRDGMTEIDGYVRVGSGDDERDKFLRGASAWLIQRSGQRPMLEAAKKRNPDVFKDVDLDPGEFRGLTPMDLARRCLERAGVNTRGMDRMRLVGEAFTRSTSYQVTGDFPVLLENVLGKVLLGAYATQQNTWERFCKTDEVPDFRTSNRYRTGSLPGLDVLPEHAEYKSGVIPDGSKYAISTQRMGKMFALSRETIINDDMSALVDMATKLGAAAMRTIETQVYALIAANAGLGPTQSDAQPFFHANRSNVNATGSAISIAGLDADRVVMRAQKDPNGQDFLDLSPAILLVPDSLRGTALQLNDAQYDPASNKFQVPNMVRGLFREVIGTPRLTGTRRYIVADPLDWIVVAFLEGYGRGPVMESQQGWRIDGVEWKVSLYAKAQMGDPKAAVTNAGV